VILIGQYDSPFVRRVGIALRLYEMPFEHRPWSVFGNAAEIARYNPLSRVPTLVLDDGEVLIESAMILDHLDEVAGPARALAPARGLERRRMLKTCALASGLADKAVSLFYETALHKETSAVWVERCKRQIAAVLDVLEVERASSSTTYWHGPQINHADIAVACVLRHLTDAHPSIVLEERWPNLEAHSVRCEAIDVFQEIAQPFIAPA
jgi:glutathione S-transferase